MQVKSVDKTTNTSFQAVLKYDKALILETLKCDKKLVQKDFTTISNVLKKVDSFEKMREDSVIKIIAREDSGQVNLICGVYDSGENFFQPLASRSVRKLTKDSDFRSKYLEDIKVLIKNVAIAEKSIAKISDTLLNSKNIRGIAKSNGSFALSPQTIKQCFEGLSFTSSLINSLSQGHNPSKKIIQLIKAIDRKSKGKEISIGIVGNRNAETHYTNTFFVVSTNVGGKIKSKRVLLSELFKKSLEGRLTLD